MKTSHEFNCNCNYCEHIRHCALRHEELIEALRCLLADVKKHFSSTEDIEYIKESYLKAKKTLKKAMKG